MAAWTFEEDFLVCDFYLNHMNDWKECIDDLIGKLKERGFDRDKGSIKMRIQNYQFLQTGKGLSNAAEQTKRIYGVFAKNISNPTLRNNLQNHIQGTYSGNTIKSVVADFDEDLLLAPLAISQLSATQQNLHHMVFTLPQEPTFKDILFGFIAQKGFKKHSDVYNACQVKRDTFNAIKKGRNYGVSKRTVMQLCFGLKLNYDEAVVLMASAGYAFAPSSLTDVIVTYYLKHELYDIFEVNISLYDSGADLLFAE